LKEADVVVIGGSAAGTVAGITVKRHYRDASALLIRREDKAMLPSSIPYIFGTLGTPDKNVIPDALLAESGIELMIDEVAFVDRVSRTLTTKGGEVVGYERLILAVGSSLVLPSVPGLELHNVFPVWKESELLEQAQRVLSRAQDIVIIGGGIIGAEVADECKKMGDVNVTIVETLPHCLVLTLDEEFCRMAEDRLEQRGIKIITGDGVRAILGNGGVSEVELQSGGRLRADVVIIESGGMPNADLARDMDIKIGEARGVWVDEYMRTSEPTIFACGDCAEKFSFFTREPSPLRSASIAAHEARVAGANVFDLKRKNRGVVGVLATAFGDFAVAQAGLTEKAARQAGFDVAVGEASAMDRHPDSMAGAREVRTKLVFDRQTGRILGGGLCDGVATAEMANIVAAMIQSEMTADEVATFQMGTHPCLTASPIQYQIVNAAEQALTSMQ